ncbi:MAG: hypothetical protein AMXMBFR58_34830 [Phycisphaerae bacterium]|nr:hypothetical protein [Phycisphaerales bacterium]
MIKWLTIILAVAGVLLAVATARTAFEDPPPIPLSRQPSINPFGRGVASLGKVESAHREILIAPPQPGLVVRVNADVGDAVKAGQPLFELDSRVIDADLIRAQAAVEADNAEIARWHALPRAEDVPPLRAVVDQFKALLADREEKLRLTREALQRGAANERDVSRDTFGRDEALASLRKAEADLARTTAGGWEADLTVARANLARSQAELAALRVLKERMTVVAPRDSVVLRRSIEAGEYASPDANRPAMILGNPHELNVRAQVDEEDIALLERMTRAVGRTRGAVVEQFDLTLVRIEPYARPKMELTGSNVERVDTRVIDVVFSLPARPRTPLYPGQAVDVFIDVADDAGTQAPPGGK